MPHKVIHSENIGGIKGGDKIEVNYHSSLRLNVNSFIHSGHFYSVSSSPLLIHSFRIFI